MSEWSLLTDYTGAHVRLTQERLDHILEHPEMMNLESALGQTLLEPEMVAESSSDPGARLYYRMEDTRLGRKYICVVVKAGLSDNFLLTAYITDRPKKGALLWPAE